MIKCGECGQTLTKIPETRKVDRFLDPSYEFGLVHRLDGIREVRENVYKALREANAEMERMELKIATLERDVS